MNAPQRLRASATTALEFVVTRPILIVDDDASSRFLVSECLAMLGLTNPRIEVADGDDAIAELRSLLNQGLQRVPALVLLDRQMPGCSGMDVLRWMRQTPGLETTAVVMLSADDCARGVRDAYELSVRSYLVKPVGFDALATVVRDLDLPWMLT
jgi:CheY-like chemotaxis protein